MTMMTMLCYGTKGWDILVKVGWKSYMLHKQGLLPEIKRCDIGFCENCILGKAHRVKFYKSQHTTKGILDYVHTDLWGPARTLSLGGASYFLSVIDDFSIRVWVYALKAKNEAFEKFKEWKVMVEKQTERKVKKLRSDSGLEFCNAEFNKFCKEQGISRHLTVPGTPQQNGLVERMSKTLLERVRCMLADSGLPKKFWAEAVCTAAYVINRSPSAALNKKTPIEVWSGRQVDYGNLKVFGSLDYAHISQGKLEPRAQKCVFLGYPEGVKGFRLWSLENLKVIVSRDVTFKESFYYKDLIGNVPNEPDESNIEEVQIEVENTSSSEVNVERQEGISEPEFSLARDRPRRKVVPPLRYRSDDSISVVAFLAVEEESCQEPLTFEEAVNSIDKDKWRQAMIEEMESLNKNGTWELVTKPDSQKLVSCKWIYKVKDGITSVEGPRYKARLVAKGFTQREGVYYTEIFSPVVKHTSIRIMLSMVAVLDLELEQMDVKTTFLHGYLDEQIYMSQPKGFEVEGQEDKVCLLKRSLYGLKQSPRQWYRRFDDYMLSHDFKRSSYDSCVYYKEYEVKKFVYLQLYVDDMLIACSDKSEIENTKLLLMSEFDMKQLGEAKKIIGMEIFRNRSQRELKVSQGSYILKVLKNYGMDNSKPVKTPLAQHFRLSSEDCPISDLEKTYMDKVPYANAVGSLMYLMVCTRPDIGYGVSLVSRYLANPGKGHWNAVKWILRYLNGTRDYGLVYKHDSAEENRILGFVDSDYAKDLNRGRSITRYAFRYWLGTGLVINETVVLCDNQGAVQLSKNNVFHEMTKHINVKLHFIRDVVNSGEALVEQVCTEENSADMFTKSLPGPKFEFCVKSLGVG
ncbi:hypothetical protein L1987_66937 [Smallanthus sonchifolius]|uniref:Uncharacterized protein n=1 Tax=Smallanthus sonchifolius TaxID=185202 RepID=A0ACB9BYU3_9ASTR|nr:hypothetical protein L1987_66937 [Smallanthus sonchifolius]